MYLLAMLERSAANPDQPWQSLWQQYLAEQLKSGYYLSYQECALLWVSLFPDENSQQPVKDILFAHFLSDQTRLQRNADRFFATITRDLGDLGDLRDLRDLSYLSYLIYTHDVAEQTINRLSLKVGIEEEIDLLTILLGRVLQIVEADKQGKEFDAEVRQIVDFVNPTFAVADDKSVREAALDILRYLSARATRDQYPRKRGRLWRKDNSHR